MSTANATTGITTTSDNIPTTFEELDNLNRFKEDIKYDLVGIEAFSENVDMYSGSLSLGQRDLIIPGNGGMDIEISRYYQLPQRKSHISGNSNENSLPTMGMGWNLHFGRITLQSGKKSRLVEFNNNAIKPTGTEEFTRCFTISETLNSHYPAVVNSGTFSLITAEGSNNQFYRAINQDHFITTDGWRGGCGQNGFVFFSPDGKKYTYDKLKYADNEKRYNYGANEHLEWSWYLSRIEDKHNNWIEFNYENVEQAKFNSIETSDGRVISFNYENDDSSPVLKTITYSGKTITYEYDDDRNLKEVIVEGSKLWDFTYKTYSGYYPAAENVYLLENLTTESGGVITYDYYPGVSGFGGVAVPFQVKTRTTSGNLPSDVKTYHPGLYSFNSIDETWFSRTQELIENDNNPTQVIHANASAGVHGDPAESVAKIANYEGKFKTTKVVESNRCTRYLFHSEGSAGIWLSGQLAAKAVYSDSSCTNIIEEEYNQYTHVKLSDRRRQKTFYEYLIGEVGYIVDSKIWKSVLKEKVILRENNEYKTTFGDFTVYGTPKTETHFGSDGKQRSIDSSFEMPAYQYGLELRDTEFLKDNDGNVISSLDYEFDDNFNVETITQNGKSNSFQYHSDGSLSRITYTGSSRYDLLEDYYRGKARKITQPCSVAGTCSTANGSTANTVILKKEVDTHGRVTSVTDFRGHKTSYDYNDLDRLELIDPEETTWANTSVGYSYVLTDGDALSLPVGIIKAGMLKQSVSKGNYRKVVYYEGLNRPIVEVEYESTATTETEASYNAALKTYTKYEYDADGNKTFTSYPSRVLGNDTNGTEYTFDALNRPLTVIRTIDEVVVSSTEYLDDYQVRVTDGESNQTTSTYLEYGIPQYSLATTIDAPDTNDITIQYNAANQVTSIEQGAITETRIYNDRLLLCKKIRPETGMSVYAYNDRNQTDWYAEGVTGSDASCDLDSVSASAKIDLGYDALNVIRTETYPDESPDRVYTYDEDGNLTSLVAGTVSHTYNYNSLGLLDDETLVVAGKRIAKDATSVSLDYEYNSLGTLAHLTYPDGDRLSYSPNALGQQLSVSRNARTARDAFNYVTNVSYHVTGQVHTFDYGNGLKHKTSLNSYKLPRCIYDGDNPTNCGDPIVNQVVALQYSYTYDNNNNALSITDHLDDAYSISNMIYDGANRLKQTIVAQGGFLGSTINYDLNGNIEDYASYGRSLDHQYDDDNRLESVSGVAGKYGSIGYDDRGNITNNGKDSFNYNLAGQMVSVDTQNITYLYDGHNRRVKQSDNSGTSGYSLYSSDGTLLYRETEDRGINYIYLGKKLIAKDGFIPQNSGKQHYRPYGESIEGEVDDVGYTGHKFDKDINLSYMQARYYDPVIGRFYSNDPIDAVSHLSNEEGINGFNRYSYAVNNPYKYTDPDGKAICGGACVGAAVAVGVREGAKACVRSAACREGARNAARNIYNTLTAIVGVFSESSSEESEGEDEDKSAEEIERERKELRQGSIDDWVDGHLPGVHDNHGIERETNRKEDEEPPNGQSESNKGKKEYKFDDS